MLSTIVFAILILGTIGSVLAGGVYFYWRFSDRRLTDLQAQQQNFNDTYEGGDISGDFAKGTVGSIRCYPPDTLFGKIKRFLLFDVGRTKVTLVIQPPVPDHFWDKLGDIIEDEDAEVIGYRQSDTKPISHFEFEIKSIQTEEVDRLIAYPIEIVDIYLGDQYKQ